MKKLALVLSLLLALTARGEPLIPTQDLTLHVTLLPNTTYEIKADVSTNAVSALLDLLTLNGQSPLQILDTNGNLLGEVPAQDLIDILTGATGTVTDQLSMVLKTAGETVNDLVVRTLNTSNLQVTNVTVTPRPAPVDQPPTVRVTSRKRTGQDHRQLRLVGMASDDKSVARVEVIANGKLVRAKGTSRFVARIKLRSGHNRIVVRAFDGAQQVSNSRRMTMMAD